MANNYRFKLSNMMPNAWFHKLRDMGRSRKQISTTTTTTTTSQSRKKKQSSSTPTSSTKHSSKPKQQHQYNIPRKSYHFTRELNLNYSHNTSDDIINTSPKTQKALNTTNFHESLRKSTKQRAKRRTSKTSLPKNSYSSSSPLELELYDPEFRTDNVLVATESLSFDDRVSLSNSNSSCGCKVLLSNNNNHTNNDIIIDVDNNSIARKDDKLGGECDDPFSELVLSPIVTKPSTTKFNDLLSDDAKNNNNKGTKPKSRMVTDKDQEHNVKGESRFTDFKSPKGSLKVKIVKEDNASMKEVKNNSSSGGGGRRLRLRVNSPRIRSRKSVSTAAADSSRRSLSDSFAIVKSSFNPERDFRQSMVEMIVHNNIRSSKDLEDLLACYLSLNSDEYHHLIIKVFKQIWFDLIDNH
ncbi:unnamed protein product [Lupinus luteus]|uniref:Transcription repressor n=1 Tax=Lupinus luteus TaxID=3873 RepID=A0AAV1W5T1_LUPLU